MKGAVRVGGKGEQWEGEEGEQPANACYSALEPGIE